MLYEVITHDTISFYLDDKLILEYRFADDFGNRRMREHNLFDLVKRQPKLDKRADRDDEFSYNFV